MPVGAKPENKFKITLGVVKPPSLERTQQQRTQRRGGIHWEKHRAVYCSNKHNVVVAFTGKIFHETSFQVQQGANNYKRNKGSRNQLQTFPCTIKEKINTSPGKRSPNEGVSTEHFHHTNLSMHSHKTATTGKTCTKTCSVSNLSSLVNTVMSAGGKQVNKS